MTVVSLKDEILHELDKLSVEQQREILEYTKTLTRPRGVPGKSLLRFAGAIPLGDLEKMTQAIEEDCETIELDEW